MTGLARRAAALLLGLSVAACGTAQPSPVGAPGSVAVHMGGSMTSYAGVGASSR